MTKRLETVLKQLTDDELEKITRDAEALIEKRRADEAPAPGWKLDWAGALKDGPYKSGLEAQEAAKHIRIFLLERSMPK